jgi:hypothetical protein
MNMHFAFAFLNSVVIVGLALALIHSGLEGWNRALLRWWGQKEVKEVRAFEPTILLTFITTILAFVFVAGPLALAYMAGIEAYHEGGPVNWAGCWLLVVATAVATDRRRTHTKPTEKYRRLGLKQVPATEETELEQLLFSIVCFLGGFGAIVYDTVTSDWPLIQAFISSLLSLGSIVLGWLLFAGFIPSLKLLRWLAERPILGAPIRLLLLRPVETAEEALYGPSGPSVGVGF